VPHRLLVVERTYVGNDPAAVDLLVVRLVAGDHIYGDRVT
jgi:hypothetical protein